MAPAFLITAFVFNSIANALLKIAAMRGIILSGSPITILRGNIFFITGLFLFAFNIVFYTLALRTLPLSVAYPIMVVGSFILVSIFSILYFKENITILQSVGYLAILGGISLVMFAKG